MSRTNSRPATCRPSTHSCGPGFSQRRKQLGSLLRNQLTFQTDFSWPRVAAAIGVKETTRGEELSLRQWIELVQRGHPAGATLRRAGFPGRNVRRGRTPLTMSSERRRGARSTPKTCGTAPFTSSYSTPPGELFLQKRSPWKDKHPNKWDSSAAGHLDAGEDYETAARRELSEELGLSPADAAAVGLRQRSARCLPARRPAGSSSAFTACGTTARFAGRRRRLRVGRVFPREGGGGVDRRPPGRFRAGFPEVLAALHLHAKNRLTRRTTRRTLAAPKNTRYMSKVCSITGARPSRGHVIHRRGLAKKKGGIGQHVTANTQARFFAQL